MKTKKAIKLVNKSKKFFIRKYISVGQSVTTQNLVYTYISSSYYTILAQRYSCRFKSLSRKDRINSIRKEVINQHQSSNNRILFSNNSNIINASIHNSNWKTGINQRNNNNNDQDSLKDTFKQPSWLTFHKTVNQLSNESNMINNRNSFNRLIDHNITEQLDNIDNDIEVLQI
ncbi:unnamed protein product [Schistosoma mattheei]|uniref:Uncharacterized protein n=1 Tax=Schistosoma mattheei TaxID=31246 RepID=A0A183PR01_9TREM|nr:unnamed protein product [Schistosoma mattheei]